MTSFNGTTVISRGARPSPITPTKLDFYNFVAGEPHDPYQVCSVHVFPNTAFGSADTYLNLSAGTATYGLVSSITTDMLFHNYSRTNAVPPLRNGFDGNVSACATESDYTGDLRYAASAIFREGTGHFSVILQPSGQYYPTSAPPLWTRTYTNNTSSTGGYLDIWTVVQTASSKAQIYVNTFTIGTANTFAVTEPLELTTVNKLVQRYVQLGSTKRLQIQTSLVVDNEPITESLRNLMETGSLLSNPEISIVKKNESPTLTSRVDITGDGDLGGFTAENVNIDSNGTISYLWNTSDIAPFYESDILGGGRGVYEVTVRYNVAEETIISPRFSLIVR